MNRSKLTICSSYLILMGVITIAVGFFYCFVPRPMAYQLNFVGMELDEINSINPRLTELLMLHVRVIGFCLLGLGATVIGLSQPFRQGKRLAWLTVVPGVLVVLVPILLISLSTGSFARWVIMVLLVLFVAATLAPIRDFFGDLLGSMVGSSSSD